MQACSGYLPSTSSPPPAQPFLLRVSGDRLPIEKKDFTSSFSSSSSSPTLELTVPSTTAAAGLLLDLGELPTYHLTNSSASSSSSSSYSLLSECCSPTQTSSIMIGVSQEQLDPDIPSSTLELAAAAGLLHLGDEGKEQQLSISVPTYYMLEDESSSSSSPLVVGNSSSPLVEKTKLKPTFAASSSSVPLVVRFGLSGGEVSFPVPIPTATPRVTKVEVEEPKRQGDGLPQHAGPANFHRRRRSNSIELEANDLRSQCKCLISLLARKRSSQEEGSAQCSQTDKEQILTVTAKMTTSYFQYLTRLSLRQDRSSKSEGFSALANFVEISMTSTSKGLEAEEAKSHNTNDNEQDVNDTQDGATSGGDGGGGHRIHYDWEVNWPQPLFKKYCFNCGNSSTGEWRAGPMGSQTLCNACGLRWKKVAPKATDLRMSRNKYKELILNIPVPVPSRKRNKSNDNDNKNDNTRNNNNNKKQKVHKKKKKQQKNNLVIKPSSSRRRFSKADIVTEDIR